MPCPPGVWREWSQWSVCTVSCGGGEQSRARQCFYDTPVGTTTVTTQWAQVRRCIKIKGLTDVRDYLGHNIFYPMRYKLCYCLLPSIMRVGGEPRVLETGRSTGPVTVQSVLSPPTDSQVTTCMGTRRPTVSYSSSPSTSHTVLWRYPQSLVDMN